MLRLLAAGAVAVTLAARGADAPGPTQVPSPTPEPLQMVNAPLAVYHPKEAWLDVWVRLNRPIKREDVSPGEYGERIVSIEALEGESIFGASPDVRFPTCYSDALDVGEAPKPGEPIEVELKLGPQQSLKATAIVQHHTHDTHAPRQLGCPRDPDGHLCSGRITTKYLTIRPETAYATSCAVARQVFISVGRRANPRKCSLRLCVTKRQRHRGFRCEAYFDNGGEGPPAYQIVCRQGRARIAAFAD